MKINQIIREKRKELSLTQEQIAEYLGVSAPAVNKWEKGSTYPDITLLPALARLLKTDLNTLLSFQEDLTDIEITNFVNQVDKIVREQNYDAAFLTAIDKIREYPTCEKLAYSVILYLEGALLLYGAAEYEHYKETFEKYYEQLAKSTNPEIRDTAASMLISYNRNRGDFFQAEELINCLPSSSIDKEEQLAILYMQQEKYPDAEKIWEHRILNHVTKIQTALINMLEVAWKEDRAADADFYAEAYEQVSRLFQVTEWISYSAKFQLSVMKRDKTKCLSVLRKMLPAMKGVWQPQDCPFYRHLRNSEANTFSNHLAVRIQSEMESSEEFSFIRDSEEYKQIIKEFASSCYSL